MEEVLNFAQNDLVCEDVMILDSGDTLFVWLGRDSNRQEREAVLTTAKDYLLSDPSGRDVDIPVILVKQGYEPPHFTGFFGAWDMELWPVCSFIRYRVSRVFHILTKMPSIWIGTIFCTQWYMKAPRRRSLENRG